MSHAAGSLIRLEGEDEESYNRAADEVGVRHEDIF